MEFFHRAKVVRLRSHHAKYLYADDDEVHVVQDRDRASSNARWWVDPIVSSPDHVRLVSRYGRYLTASSEPFLLGFTGRKVVQTCMSSPDSSTEWEPQRDGFQVRFKTRHGNFLRANGGVPPWRNSITHDVPSRSSTQDWVLWDVEVVQVVAQPAGVVPPTAFLEEHDDDDDDDDEKRRRPIRPPPPPPLDVDSIYTTSDRPDPQLTKLESSDSFATPVQKVEGRLIHCHVADDNGNVDEESEGLTFTFDGSNLEELNQKVEEETGLKGIIICCRNKFSGKLVPLLLGLPPNNAPMHIVVVEESSTIGQTLDT